MNDFQNRHRTSYNIIADTYAKTNAAMVPEVLRSAECFIKFLDSNGCILDVGCGHGRETAWFVSHGYRTMGYDLSRGMLEQTRKLIKVPLIQGNMLRLPFPKWTFDALWCNAAFLHIPKVIAKDCLQEFKRILVKEGLLYLALQAGSSEVWEKQSYGMETPRFFARYSSHEVKELLLSTGFHVLIHSENNNGPRSHWLHFIVRNQSNLIT